MFQINLLSFHLKKLEERIKPVTNRRQITIKIRIQGTRKK